MRLWKSPPVHEIADLTCGTGTTRQRIHLRASQKSLRVIKDALRDFSDADYIDACVGGAETER